ncbi:MAG: hypothetical protein ACRCZF_06380, partial [Gemmataceae bacterium]
MPVFLRITNHELRNTNPIELAELCGQNGASRNPLRLQKCGQSITAGMDAFGGGEVTGVRSYDQRLRIWESNYGRDAGWVIERQGEVIAVLTDPRFEDMFWDSYRMDVVASGPELRMRM